MKKLLQIEWMKVKSYRTFWVLMGLFVAAIVGINYITYRGNLELKKNIPMGEMLTGSPFSFPQIWNTISWMSSWVLYFPGFIIIFLVSNEYTFKTHRQNIIDGLSRKQFVITKLFVAFILSVICTILVFLSTVMFGFLSDSTFTTEGLSVIGNFFICSWVYILFALLLAFLFRKAILAIGVFFVYGLIIDNILTFFIRWSTSGKPIGNYVLPIDVADSLIPHPFQRQTSGFMTGPNITICFILCVAWIIFYHLFTIRKFQAEDL
jgi:hypothetical protein